MTENETATWIRVARDLLGGQFAAEDARDNPEYARGVVEFIRDYVPTDAPPFGDGDQYRDWIHDQLGIPHREELDLDSMQLPPLPFPPGASADLSSLVNPYSSLHVDSDVGDGMPDDAVAITVVHDGLGHDIIVSRRELLRALGVNIK